MPVFRIAIDITYRPGMSATEAMYVSADDPETALLIAGYVNKDRMGLLRQQFPDARFIAQAPQKVGD